MSSESDISRLEARMDNLEKAIDEIKSEQVQTRSLSVLLATLNAQLSAHLKAHEDMDKRKFSNAELILVGIQAAAAAVMIFVK